MIRKLFPSGFLFFVFSSSAQTFEVEQVEQLFRPRLKVDTRYISDSKFKDTTGTFNQKEANMAFTFPIKTKLGAEINLNTESLKLKDILRNSVKIKASQTLGLLRVNTRQSNFGFDSLPQKDMYNITAGVMGVSLTKKFRVMFYSVNASISEQDKTIDKAVPRATALIGQLHIRGLRKNFFYGIAANYSDGLPIASPFFGGSKPLGKKFIFNYTLPVQVNLQYKDDRKTLITVGVTADGYRSGIQFNGKRVNVNYTAALAYASIRYKFTRSFVGRIEGGYVIWQNIRYTKSSDYQYSYNPMPGPYVQAGFNVLFGKTLWEKVYDAFKN
jgi:hypothetical protein